jgi:hypothetical protein
MTRGAFTTCALVLLGLPVTLPTAARADGPKVGGVSIDAQDVAQPPGSPLAESAPNTIKSTRPTTSVEPATPAASSADYRKLTSDGQKKLVLIDRLVSKASVDQSESSNGSLDQGREQYRVVRKLFGGEHVVLTAAAYLGRRCKNDGQAHSLLGDACGKETRGGAAGIVMVPIIGAGGGHGFNFWPVVQTEDEVTAFLEFQQSLQVHADFLAATWATFQADPKSLDLDDMEDLSARVRAFRESLKEEFQREVDTKGAHAKLAQMFIGCLAQLESANLGLQLEWDRLSHLWQEYSGIIENPDNVARRHNFLLGPFIGAPITEDPVKLMLYGLGAEVGTQGFRVTLGVGWTADYSAALVPVTGWVATLGLSGEWGDDLLHYLSGARDAANGLKKTVSP